MSADERERSDRLRSEAHRARFERARAALRGILGRYLERSPADVEFAYGPTGKPALAAPDSLRFNLSHSGDVALCAVARRGEVGVDVEEQRPIRDFRRIAQRHFAPVEQERWASEGETLESFYAVWTRKEAMLKASGSGLTRPLERVDSERGTLDGVVYWLRDLDPGPGFAAAIACEAEPMSLQGWRWAGG